MAIERRVRLRVVLRAIEEYKGMSALCAFCARFALFCAVVYLHRGVWDGSARAEAITAITAFGGDDYHETVLADQTTIRQAYDYALEFLELMVDDSEGSHADDARVYVGDSSRVHWARLWVNLEENCAHEERGLPCWKRSRHAGPGAGLFANASRADDGGLAWGFADGGIHGLDASPQVYFDLVRAGAGRADARAALAVARDGATAQIVGQYAYAARLQLLLVNEYADGASFVWLCASRDEIPSEIRVEQTAARLALYARPRYRLRAACELLLLVALARHVLAGRAALTVC